MRVPQGWQLALASRESLPIPTAQLRAQGKIMELGSRELAMSAAEAVALLIDAGIEAPTEGTDDLLQRTEGWPVGLYLAALATKAGTPLGEIAFGGEDRWIGDYLRSELLSRVNSDQRAFCRAPRCWTISVDRCAMPWPRRAAPHARSRTCQP